MSAKKEVEIGLLKDERRKRAQIYAIGGQRALNFVHEVITGKRRLGREKYCFDHRFLKGVNREVLFYAHPSVKGQIRDENYDNTEVDTEPVVSGRKLAYLFPRFGLWLQRQFNLARYRPYQPLESLHQAAAIHWGITRPEFHPFIDGNGRTARAVMNGFLTVGTPEVNLGLKLVPVSLMRVLPERGKADPYILALRQIKKENRLNPFMGFIARLWVGGLDELLERISQELPRPNLADQRLICSFKSRRELLNQFLFLNGSNRCPDYPIPTDYFEVRDPCI